MKLSNIFGFGKKKKDEEADIKRASELQEAANDIQEYTRKRIIDLSGNNYNQLDPHITLKEVSDDIKEKYHNTNKLVFAGGITMGDKEYGAYGSLSENLDNYFTIAAVLERISKLVEEEYMHSTSIQTVFQASLVPNSMDSKELLDYCLDIEKSIKHILSL